MIELESLKLNKVGGIRLYLIGMFQCDAAKFRMHFADHDIILGEVLPGGANNFNCCKENQRKAPYLSNTSKGPVKDSSREDHFWSPLEKLSD